MNLSERFDDFVKEYRDNEKLKISKIIFISTLFSVAFGFAMFFGLSAAFDLGDILEVLRSIQATLS